MAGTAQSAPCSETRVTVKGAWGQAHFNVSVADDPEERAQGLMDVPDMPTMSGMLFIYDQPQHAHFWMRNTLIPLDMIFASRDGRIAHIHENAIPHDETVIDGGVGVFAVLEVNGGLAGRLGVEIGDVLQHPGFGAEGILLCNAE